MFQVKWFNKKKGFGFVSDESAQEYFCHHTDININGFKYLKSGEYISGTVGTMDKGKVKVVPGCWCPGMCLLLLRSE